jgi:hypothetical protein
MLERELLKSHISTIDSRNGNDITANTSQFGSHLLKPIVKYDAVSRDDRS